MALQGAQFRRALTIRLSTLTLVVAPALFSVGFVMLARTLDLDAPGAQSFTPYAEGTVASATAQLAAQMISIWTLIAGGFAIAWSVGREWSDGTYGSLFALPVPRSHVAWAKVIVTAGWGAASVTLASALIAAAIGIVDGEHLTPQVGAQLGRVWVSGLLMMALALTFGAVAARFRGYLGAIAAIIAAVAASQILASLGIGAWVPFVAPALWAGAAGADAGAAVTPWALLGAVAFSAAGVLLLVRIFSRARLD